MPRLQTLSGRLPPGVLPPDEETPSRGRNAAQGTERPLHSQGHPKILSNRFAESIGGRVDLATGEVWPEPAIDYAREIGQEDEDESDDPDKWLWVHCEGSRDGYRDMELFIETVRDPGRADRLEIAISGRAAFRRFKDVLARWPGELDRWYTFSAERQRGRARAWLAEAGYYVRKGLPPS